jgi:hypothetical protein
MELLPNEALFLGRSASDGNGGVVLVVDGLKAGLENLATMLLSDEGWEFELRIMSKGKLPENLQDWVEARRRRRPRRIECRSAIAGSNDTVRRRCCASLECLHGS